jgi:hypothetical protein
MGLFGQDEYQSFRSGAEKERREKGRMEMSETEKRREGLELDGMPSWP